MTKIYFISDLHLNDQAPETLAAFQHFLENEGQEARALYILGDLFEAWIGDDTMSATAATVAKSLLAYQSQGKQLFYMHGNRDFLLGEDFARRCEMEILPDPSVIELGGEKIVITHGDLLCTDDKAYQAFRKVVHQSWLQKLYLSLPLKFRQKIAGLLRQKSKAAGPKKTSKMMDVNEDAAIETMLIFGARKIIHGHTHKPAYHKLESGKRYVLGAWDEQWAVLEYSDGEFDLQFRAK